MMSNIKNLHDQFIRVSYNDFQSGVYYENSNFLKVVFKLGNTCTYNCSYCGAGDKDGSLPWVDLKKSKEIIKKIYDIYSSPPYNKTQILYEFLGGEVTVWNGIEELSKTVKELKCNSSIITNASRSLRWWEEYGGNFTDVIISYHSEYSTKEHCVNVGNILADKSVYTGMSIMMNPLKWNNCIEALEYAKSNGNFTFISFGKLRSKDIVINYTDEQIEWFKYNSTIVLNRQHIPEYRRDKVLWRDSKTNNVFQKSPREILALDINDWKNWHCFVGIDTMFLEANGDIRRSSACELEIIGNWLTDDIDNIKWPISPVVCPYNKCYCMSDIDARKFKNKPDIL